VDLVCKRFSLFLSLFMFVGCGPRSCSQRSDISAEEQLRSYIDLAVNITRSEQREDLESLTTGEFRDQLASNSPEAFKKAYLDRRYEFEEFEVTGRSDVVPEKEVELEYRVKFRSWMSGEDRSRAPMQEIKSLARMKYTRGQWAIAAIRPIDTQYNWDVGLPMAGVSTNDMPPESGQSESPASAPQTAPVAPERRSNPETTTP
jgi:hypothetical protein